MKRLLTLLLAIVFVLSLAACGEKKEEEKPDPNDTVLADTAHELWAALGQHELADGTVNGWGDKEAALFQKSALKAISLNEVKKIDEALFNTLTKKEVKYLYTIDLIFGMNDAGWQTKFVKDGQLYNANGSYAFKIGQCSSEVDGENKVYSVDQWISDPHTAYVESLTPATAFYPTWQETADDYGMSWADNPVAIGGAGLYTLVVAQYKNASAEGKPGYGVALILKEAKEGGKEYEKIETWVPADHTYGVIGSFEGSNWETDVAMTKGENNTWTAEVTLAEGNEFKVRADGAWTFSWGNGADNFKCEAAGTYVVTITFDAAGNGTVTFAAK